MEKNFNLHGTKKKGKGKMKAKKEHRNNCCEKHSHRGRVHLHHIVKLLSKLQINDERNMLDTFRSLKN